MLKFYTFWGAGESIGGGQAPPGVRVILTLAVRRSVKSCLYRVTAGLEKVF